MRTCRSLFAGLLMLLVCASAGAQIRNRLDVSDDIFQRYAYGRMQQYSESNLVLADSIYNVGVEKESYRLKALALSLEMSPRFALKQYDRMDAIAQEIKDLLESHPEWDDFYFVSMYDYCQFLIFTDRVSDAMLEARAMERKASEDRNALGRMYAFRVIGLIQMYRTNSPQAIENFKKSAEYCKEASAEQELPNLYILIAQELIKLKKYDEAVSYCSLAEEYQDFFPSLKVKVLMTKAYLYNSQGDRKNFWACYDSLVGDSLYELQVDEDTRFEMDITALRSRKLFEEALAKSDSLGTARSRFEQKYAVYADLGDFKNAYSQLLSLMEVKDSIYVAVQNEDMAILDAELGNAQLRQDAERLKARNQITLLLGFIILFAIAFFSIIFSQWRLRQNLDVMRAKNREMHIAREAYQHALDAKEQENAIKVRLIQNRKNSGIRL